MPQTKRVLTYYDVPAGTQASPCRGSTCGARCYWIRTPKGRPLLIDCDVDGGKRPSMSKDLGQLDAFAGEAEVYDGRGVSHFETCSDADEFSGGRR